MEYIPTWVLILILIFWVPICIYVLIKDALLLVWSKLGDRKSN